MYQFPEGFYTKVTVKKEITTTIAIDKKAAIQKNTETKSSADIEMTSGDRKQTVHVEDVRKLEEEMKNLAEKMKEEKKDVCHPSSQEKKENIFCPANQEKQKAIAQLMMPENQGNLTQLMMSGSQENFARPMTLESQERNLSYGNMNITHLPILMKENLTKECARRGKEKMGERFYSAFYEDGYCTKTVVSSDGTECIRDEQYTKAGYYYEKENEIAKKQISGHYFEDLAEQVKQI